MLDYFNSLNRSNQRGLLGGSVIILLMVALFVFKLLSTAWAPSLFKWEVDELVVDLCGPSVELMEEAAAYAPGCNFVFLDLQEDYLCENDGDRVTAVYGDPTRSDPDSSAGATTRIWMKDVEGWYMAADAGQGEPGWVAVGTAAGAEIIIKEGEDDPRIVGHELNHVCGRWHPFMARWMKRWGVYENLHVLSPGSKTLGGSTEGLDYRNGLTYYEPGLIDVEGSEKPEDP